MITRFAKYICGTLFLLLISSTAFAAIEDRGISVGAGKLHPYYQLEPHFATNPSRKEVVAGTSDMEILNRLGLAIDADVEKIKVNMDLSGEYDWYLGLQSAATKRYSDWGLNLNLGMHIAHKRKYSVKIDEIFSRSANAYDPAISSGLSLLNNNTGLALIMKPGGGALDLILSYNFMLYWYMADGYSPEALQNMRHKVTFQSTWRFFPKTALNFTVTATPTIYLGNEAGALTEEGSAAYPSLSSYKNPNAMPITATIGLVGLMTTHLAFNASVGYGTTILLQKEIDKKADILHAVIGKLELKYLIKDKGTIKVGYVRDVGPTSLYRFYAKNMWYIGYEQSILDKRLVLDTKVSYSMFKFGEELIPNNNYSGRRQDGVLGGEFSIAYNCKRIFSIALIDRLEYRHSKYITFAGTGVGYITNNLFLRLEVRY